MAVAFWKNSSALTGFGSKSSSTSLDAALKRATHSEKVDVDKDALLEIVQASHHEEDRRTIMRHLYTCLNDVSSSKWRCINAGLVVADGLLSKGSRKLVSETAAGAHFDLVQRVSLLEKFEYILDKRVEAMVRRRALSLRGAWLEAQQQQVLVFEEEEKQQHKVQWRAGVNAFHNDDTDDDLSDAELDHSSGPSRSLKGQQGIQQEESTTDGESSGYLGQSPRTTPVAEPARAVATADQGFMDLIGMEKSEHSPRSESLPQDLLDF